MNTKEKNPVCETHYTCRDEAAFQRFESLARRVQDAIEILPVEVKSGVNVKARSLKSYREKYHIGQALRFSMQNLKRDDGLLNIPLYLIHRFHDSSF